jgi:hypothetical protein
MKKPAKAAVCLLLLFSPVLLSAQAAPAAKSKVWYKDWVTWAVIGFSLGASAAATHFSHECRVKYGVAPCDGGYGEYKAREIVRGVGTLGEDAVALGMRHAGFKFKEWAPVAFGLPAYNTSVAYRQTLKGCPAGEHYLAGTKYTCTSSSWGYDETISRNGGVFSANAYRAFRADWPKLSAPSLPLRLR